jgi:hypothetical protein
MPLLEKRIRKKMAERRKIIVPVGSKPETPHFDAEETLLSARPVVPITTAAPVDNFERAHAPFYKRNGFLVLVVMAAIGIGLAAGLGIARLRTQPAPVAAQPVEPAPVETRTATVQPAKDNQQVPALPEVKTEERVAIKDEATESQAKANAPEAPVKVPAKERETSADRDDEAKTSTPSTREKKRTSDDEESDEVTTPRAQKRERRERRRNDETVDIPRSMQRASEQINRIREIFEGRQQRP